MFSRLKQSSTYPFGLLLYLEWILLFAAGFVKLPETFLAEQQYQIFTSFYISSVFSLISLLLLGLLGLKLPCKNIFNKWLYMILQLIIIWLPTILLHQTIPFFTAFLVVVMRNCQIFGKSKEYWLTNAFVFMAVMPSLPLSVANSYEKLQFNLSQYQNISLEEFKIHLGISHFGSLFLVGLSFAFICILVDASLRQYQSQQQLTIAREQLRLYALKAKDCVFVNERNRIAREIHDSVGHTLTAQTIQLNNAIAFWQAEPHKAYQFLTEAKELVKTALTDIRHSVTTLRVAPLQGKSLPKALSLLFQEFSSTTGIVPNYNIDLAYSLAEETKLTVYRIVQEALTNIAKHSEATVVNVHLNSSAKNLYFLIEDNGRGFALEQNTTGFGLQGMRERVMALNGKIDTIENPKSSFI